MGPASSAPWVHKARKLPKEEFKREVDRYLTGKETEPWEIIYFKLYKGQLAVVERALEIAALMLGTDKSRGYSPEMICADFLAGSALEAGGSEQNHGRSAFSGVKSGLRRGAVLFFYDPEISLAAIECSVARSALPCCPSMSGRYRAAVTGRFLDRGKAFHIPYFRCTGQPVIDFTAGMVIN
jgi:hypothetical protein